MLSTNQKKTIQANVPKAILMAYEYNNTEMLDYALEISTEVDRYRAKNLAIMKGVDIDVTDFDHGNPPR